MSKSRIEHYQKLLQQKKQDLAAVERDLAIPQSAVDESRSRKQAEQLLQDIEELEQQINGYNIQQLNNAWDNNIYKINYQRAQYQISNLLDNFDEGSGSALFLIQQSQSYCGEYCIQHLKERSGKCGVPKAYYVSIKPDESSILDNFLQNLGEKLKIDLTDVLPQNVGRLIDALCDSLQGCSILFLEMHFDLVNPDHDFLKWLIQDFWRQLIERRTYMLKNNPGLKIVGTVKFDIEIPEDLIVDLCCINQVIMLEREKWQSNEIYNWLRDFSCSGKPQAMLQNISNDIYNSTNEGMPYLAKDKLFRTLQQLVS